MAGKYKATGCARFFLFLIIIIPIAYFGIKYGVEKGVINFDDEASVDNTEITNDYKESDSDDPYIRKIENKMSQLVETIKEQQSTMKDQEKTINKQQDIIEQLKTQLEAAGRRVDTKTKVPTTQQQPKSSGSESLDELLKEADKALRDNKN